jgi:hypothetical protein
VSAAPNRPALPGIPPPLFVGRERELALLREHLPDARASSLLLRPNPAAQGRHSENVFR